LKKSKNKNYSVFINCPFIDQFKPILHAIIFAIKDSGFAPHYLLEKQTSIKQRWDRLVKLINDCKYGVHDLSYTDPDPDTGLPLFNMPLELGVFLGCANYGGQENRKKDCVILERIAHNYDKFCSDLSGLECRAHNNEPRIALRIVRNWLSEHSSELLPSAEQMWQRFQEFKEYLRLKAEYRGTPIPEMYPKDFLLYLRNWLLHHPGLKTF
jgi:hypothetical protein